MGELKRCTKCGCEKPATAEFYGPARTTRDRLRPECRTCKSALCATRRAEREAQDPKAAGKRLARQNARRAKKRDLYNSLTADWRRRNRREIAAYARRKKAEDPIMALSSRVRCLIYTKLRRGGYTKRSRTYEILGCDFETLAAHLAAKFQPGMSWENRGEWHIDHIVPLATAQTEEDVIRLNHYTNLQPLWAADNLAKGARLDWVPKPTGDK